jgi:hypothetical protein
MASENLALWERLGKTDPKHTKSFKRSGGFGGTAIKPIYTEQKMTEQFGPCGVGWGINEPTYQVVPASEGQVAVYCTTSIWIRHEDKVSAPIYGVGGDLVVVKQSSGLRTDDEAFKKAFTDAVGNAMKHLGMSADVHMGLFDDSKYVREREREEAAEDFTPPPPNPEALSKAKTRALWGEMRDELDACSTVEQLGVLWMSRAYQDSFKTLPADWQRLLVEHKDGCKVRLDAAGIPKVRPNFDALDKAGV